MKHHRYVIIGGGMTADAAAHGIRELDPEGSLALIRAETPAPYQRPPLSKGLWKGDAEDGIWRDTAATGAELHLGREVVHLDPVAKRVTDDAGVTYGYDKLLLATGGSPRRLPVEAQQIIYFRTYDDYRRLRALAGHPLRFAVIGGGFMGAEIAAALRMQGRDVVMLVPERGLGARLFPANLSTFLVDYYREKGIEIRTGDAVAGAGSRDGRVVLQTTAGHEVEADVVVAGSASGPTSRSPSGRGWPWRTASSWTSSCAPAIPTFTRRATWRLSTTRRSAPAFASSTKTTPT